MEPGAKELFTDRLCPDRYAIRRARGEGIAELDLDHAPADSHRGFGKVGAIGNQRLVELLADHATEAAPIHALFSSSRYVPSASRAFVEGVRAHIARALSPPDAVSFP